MAVQRVSTRDGDAGRRRRSGEMPKGARRATEAALVTGTDVPKVSAGNARRTGPTGWVPASPGRPGIPQGRSGSARHCRVSPGRPGRACSTRPGCTAAPRADARRDPRPRARDMLLVGCGRASPKAETRKQTETPSRPAEAGRLREEAVGRMSI